MKYKLQFIAKEYEHGWSVWLKRDETKFMIGSGIETEDEVERLMLSIGIGEKIKYEPKEKIKELKSKIKELEKYKNFYDNLSSHIKANKPI